MPFFYRLDLHWIAYLLRLTKYVSQFGRNLKLERSILRQIRTKVSAMLILKRPSRNRHVRA